MKRELNQKSLEELIFIKEWSLVIVDFFLKKDEAFFEQMYPIIADAFDKKNLRGLRMLYNDNNAMAREELRPNELEELNQILRDKFGVDLINDHGKLLAKINRIIKRGHLKSDDEFRLLYSRVEDIYADDSKKNEVEILSKLMGDYENSKRIKLPHV